MSFRLAASHNSSSTNLHSNCIKQITTQHAIAALASSRQSINTTSTGGGVTCAPLHHGIVPKRISRITKRTHMSGVPGGAKTCASGTMWRIGNIRMRSIRFVKCAGKENIPLESYASISEGARARTVCYWRHKSRAQLKGR